MKKMLNIVFRIVYLLINITKYRKYREAVWLTLVTFLTVGYGDFYPTTNLGRYMMIFTAMGG